MNLNLTRLIKEHDIDFKLNNVINDQSQAQLGYLV